MPVNVFYVMGTVWMERRSTCEGDKKKKKEVESAVHKMLEKVLANARHCLEYDNI